LTDSILVKAEEVMRAPKRGAFGSTLLLLPAFWTKIENDSGTAV
jgi:hypothetical protein